MNLILESLSLNPTPQRPVWLMRQAGRYQASFRKLRETYSFEDLCHQPDLATKVTLTSVKQFQLDAAIVFSDILFPLRAMGADLHFAESGPVLKEPQSISELSRYQKAWDPREKTPAILKTLQNLRAELSPEVAVLGFAGAPFTLLAYLLEGRLSKNLKKVKRWMAEYPKEIHALLDFISMSTGDYLEAQGEAGADAVQLFDTWASELTPQQYEEFALPYARKALSVVTVPTLYFVNGVSGILESAASSGCQGLSVDYRVSLSEVRRRLSHVLALQGNLDPMDLYLPHREIRERVFKMCDAYGKGPGHIVNLGHGVLPDISEDAVKVFVESAREWSLAHL